MSGGHKSYEYARGFYDQGADSWCRGQCGRRGLVMAMMASEQGYVEKHLQLQVNANGGNIYAADPKCFLAAVVQTGREGNRGACHLSGTWSLQAALSNATLRR